MNPRLYFKTVLNIIKKNKIKGIKNLLLYCIDEILEPNYVRANIISIQIEPTRKCNLSCSFCDRTLERTRAEELSLEDFRIILEKMPFLQKISLVGVGEPLLNSNLFEMVKYAKSKGIRIGFATNGTLLKDDINRQIMASDLDWLNISLDGATKPTFERIRSGADFEKVIENIAALIRLKGKKKNPEVSVWFLMVKQNIQELNKLVLLAKKIGIKKINIQTVHYWAKGIWLNTIKPEMITDNLNEVKAALLNARNIARAEGIDLDYVNIPDTGTKRCCKWPWRASYITADGFVTPCCMQGTDPRIINFGNIFKDEFDAIWNNASYRNFRQQLKSDSIPSICIDCPSYYRKIKI